MIEQLLHLRARKLHARRPWKLAKRPAQPRAAELAYTADLRKLVKSWADVVAQRVIPAIPHVDDLHSPYNEFVIAQQEIRRYSSPQVIIPMARAQTGRVSAFTSRELGRSLGIGYEAFNVGATNILTPQTDAFISENVDLITSLSDGYIDRVGSILSDMQGARVEDISDALQLALGVTQSHADLIAVDQTLKLNSQFTQTRQQQVGITEYMWMTAHDERVRPDHRALDMTRHSWNDEPPIVDSRTGRREPPGRDFRCRCQAIAVIPD